MDVKAITNVQTSVEMNSQNFDVKVAKNLQNDKNQHLQNQDQTQKLEKKQASPEVIEKIVEDLKKKLSMLNTQLKIQIDKDTDMVVVKVIDKTTNKVIRQIPPEYVLKIAKYLDEIAGLLYNEKV
ncbi:flagellar protein FlaG [Desulfurobacterium pacificum]|uniref:Flagellar protein FlaG n=1 Tax=Desulfurobacterium pacificum TaxID=240166 RepID=A0ABY1ND84_9BACT|nr:flagellar protein FlaG [Desulfurobacterium pacificum]SMP06925.1 flagellar protein FlaG [Desulfurobacterium pacificum]